MEWHDFYAVIGEASATLVALIFVAASIGAEVFTAKHQAGIRSFLSPTVVHFTAVLVICFCWRASRPKPEPFWALFSDASALSAWSTRVGSCAG
jgi:hypothetical protein